MEGEDKVQVVVAEDAARAELPVQHKVIPVNPATPVPRAIDRVVAAFRGALWRYEIPEWGMTVYFSALTTADMVAIKTNMDDKDTSPFERNVRLFAHKACDENGQQLFSAADVPLLMTKARFGPINRAINFMFDCGSLSKGDAEKMLGNLTGSGPTSTSPAA